MLQIMCDNAVCEEVLEKVREILDKPELLAFEKAEDIMALLFSLTLENEEGRVPRKVGRSLDELENEIFK